MKESLLRHKPKDSTREEFTKAWEGAGYTLEPLYKAIETFKREIDNVSSEDFNCPNHYARMVWREGQLKAYNNILSLLPESAKPDGT